MTVSATTGTGFSSSRSEIYGRIVIANGSLVFFKRELLCGIQFNVHCMYSRGAFDVGESVRAV